MKMSSTSRKLMKNTVIGLVGFILIISSTYTVPEGHMGIVLRFQEAVGDAGPGFHFKLPFVDSIGILETRQKRYSLDVSVVTTNVGRDGETSELQVPSNVVITANWSVPTTSALEVYKEFGTLEQYENRIIDPRVRDVARRILSKYTIEYLIGNREVITPLVVDALEEALDGQLVNMTDVIIENIQPSIAIQNAVERKQTAKLAAEEEAYRLERQNLEAQQTTNNARAEADSILLIAEAEASRKRMNGAAEADAIDAEGRALREYPEVLELRRIQQWDGVLPQTVLGSNTDLMMQMK